MVLLSLTGMLLCGFESSVWFVGSEFVDVDGRGTRSFGNPGPPLQNYYYLCRSLYALFLDFGVSTFCSCSSSSGPCSFYIMLTFFSLPLFSQSDSSPQCSSSHLSFHFTLAHLPLLELPVSPASSQSPIHSPSSPFRRLST